MNNEVKIYYEGPSGSIAPKSTISVSVYIDAESPVNAFDLSAVFPEDKFEFMGSDNTGSIVNIWQTKPESSSSGVIDLSGGIPASFVGTKGLLIKFLFKAKDISNSEEKVNLSFSKSDFFLADGKGTKVLGDSPSYNIAVKKNSEVVAQSFTSFQDTPSDIIIAEELQDIKSEAAAPNTLLMPGIVFFVIIFVICILAVYNRKKHKL